MRVANPRHKFFTADLFPEDGETGNALWGYHIANNFLRLMAVEGTVYFGTSNLPISIAPFPSPYVVGTYRIADIPIANLSLHAAPIVQFAALRPRVFETATTYTTSLETGLKLTNDVKPQDLGISCVSESQDLRFILQTLLPQEYDVKLGENDSEVLLVRNNGWMFDESVGQYFYFFNIIQRNRYSTPSGLHNSGENFRLITTARMDTALSAATLWEINPSYVEGYLDQQKLRIKWMLHDAGTLVYKIFGV